MHLVVREPSADQSHKGMYRCIQCTCMYSVCTYIMDVDVCIDAKNCLTVPIWEIFNSVFNLTLCKTVKLKTATILSISIHV